MTIKFGVGREIDRTHPAYANSSKHAVMSDVEEGAVRLHSALLHKPEALELISKLPSWPALTDRRRIPAW